VVFLFCPVLVAAPGVSPRHGHEIGGRTSAAPAASAPVVILSAAVGGESNR